MKTVIGTLCFTLVIFTNPVKLSGGPLGKLFGFGSSSKSYQKLPCDNTAQESSSVPQHPIIDDYEFCGGYSEITAVKVDGRWYDVRSKTDMTVQCCLLYRASASPRPIAIFENGMFLERVPTDPEGGRTQVLPKTGDLMVHRKSMSVYKHDAFHKLTLR